MNHNSTHMQFIHRATTIGIGHDQAICYKGLCYLDNTERSRLQNAPSMEITEAPISSSISDRSVYVAGLAFSYPS